MFIHKEQGVNIRTENKLFSGTKSDETILFVERRVHLNNKKDIKSWLAFVEQTLDYLESCGYITLEKPEKVLIDLEALKNEGNT